VLFFYFFYFFIIKTLPVLQQQSPFYGQELEDYFGAKFYCPHATAAGGFAAERRAERR